MFSFINQYFGRSSSSMVSSAQRAIGTQAGRLCRPLTLQERHLERANRVAASLHSRANASVAPRCLRSSHSITLISTTTPEIRNTQQSLLSGVMRALTAIPSNRTPATPSPAPQDSLPLAISKPPVPPKPASVRNVRLTLPQTSAIMARLGMIPPIAADSTPAPTSTPARIAAPIRAVLKTPTVTPNIFPQSIIRSREIPFDMPSLEGVQGEERTGLIFDSLPAELQDGIDKFGLGEDFKLDPESTIEIVRDLLALQKLSGEMAKVTKDQTEKLYASNPQGVDMRRAAFRDSPTEPVVEEHSHERNSQGHLFRLDERVSVYGQEALLASVQLNHADRSNASREYVQVNGRRTERLRSFFQSPGTNTLRQQLP